MRKYMSLLLGLVFAASIGISACAKKEAPPPPPPPPPASAPSDNTGMAPGGEKGMNQQAPMNEQKPMEQAPEKK